MKKSLDSRVLKHVSKAKAHFARAARLLKKACLCVYARRQAGAK